MKHSLKVIFAVAAAFAMSACGHHNTTSAQPSPYYIDGVNLLSNKDYQGQLRDVNPKGIRPLLRKACGGQCGDRSPDAYVDFMLIPGTNQATLQLTFVSQNTGAQEAYVRVQVEVEPNRNGEALHFRSVDVSGTLHNGVLSLRSSSGLIGDAELVNL